jgi:hypothetical protein
MSMTAISPHITGMRPRRPHSLARLAGKALSGGSGQSKPREPRRRNPMQRCCAEPGRRPRFYVAWPWRGSPARSGTRLAIRRCGQVVPGPSDLGELILTHYDGQHDLAARASLAQHAGRSVAVIAIGGAW